jgi:tRNA wybutosine-synthesizing protein 3
MPNFLNNKKTFLSKLDKSKKGDIDEKVIPLLKIINSKDNYYTTSSCSGRIYLWSGSGKKNECHWLKVSHELIDEKFFELKDTSGLVWLRLEDIILHICCKDLDSANKLLELSRRIYKKSCILSASNKVIVEIHGSEFIEMSLYKDGKLLFSGEIEWLVGLVNSRMKKIWERMEKYQKQFA